MLQIPLAPNSNPPVFGHDKPWLAPLAGYSDLPFRLLCREYGAAVCETEMISAKGLLFENRRTGKLLESTYADSPLVVQLFGSEPEVMANAVRLLRRHGYFWFDCNLGCSVRKVLRQGSGAALLGNPDHAVAIAKAMVKASSGDDGLPEGMVGFKLRLGLSPATPVLPDLASRLEEAGASWITLHPRYASQGFSGTAKWDALAILSRALRIPVLASGDLLSATAAHECVNATGVSGVMYARGALYNPGIFREHVRLLKGQRPPLTLPELRRLVFRHMELAKKYGPPKNSFIKMRSILPRYVRNFPGVGELRRMLCSAQDWEDLYLALDRYLPSTIEEL